MLSIKQIYAQQSLDSFGSIGNIKNISFNLNNLESNISNYNNNKDWEFIISTKSIFGKKQNMNLKTFALGKKIDKHYLYIRYSPGISQNFIFNSRAEFIIGDTIQTYKTKLSYSEKYGFGYSYNFNNRFTAGFTLRYFRQNFKEEYPTYFSNTDSNKTIIQIQEEELEKNFWRGDIGIMYKPFTKLQLSLSSLNLFILKEYKMDEENSEFEIKTNNFNIKQNKGILLGIKYFPHPRLTLDFRYESTGSFLAGFNYVLDFYNGIISAGLTAFHDKFQRPFLAGFQPAINYSTDLFSITLSFIKYSENRKTIKTLNDFRTFGIASIQNNYFNRDNLNLTFNFALSFKNEAMVKIIDVKIKDEIYPTESDNYINKPFAVGEIVNLTNKKISVKPASYIEEINTEKVYSPIITILPHDTVKVPFFTIIADEKNNIEKRKIAQAEFSVKTLGKIPDDKISKPILINNKNSWDGNVHNLRYFVKADLDFAHKFATKILQKNKKNLSGTNPLLEQFNKIKVLFKETTKNMTYVSDRRATSDYVQFPNETIKLKGGDCDDLSVCVSALFESVGIQTAFIDYKPNGSVGHVSLLVNTNLSPSDSKLITINDRKFFTRKNINGKEEIWIPLETTIFGNFNESWNFAASQFYKKAIDELGLSKSKVEIVDVY